MLPQRPVGGFPDVSQALPSPNGLLAAGGALTPDWLLAAYARGIFPWFGPDEPILWWSPSPRCVLFSDELHLSRRFRRTLRSRPLRWTMDRCFERVMRACAAPRRDASGTWITSRMLAAYTELHRLGHAHSIEVWDKDLVGGLYGVCIGRMFFAESMFSGQPNGSKYAMHYLTRRLQAAQFPVIDCQVTSPHIQRMGAREISRDRFQALLERQTALPAPDADWWARCD